jgi:hypothetical protein
LSQDLIEELLVRARGRLVLATAIRLMADIILRTLDNKGGYLPLLAVIPVLTIINSARPISYDGTIYYDYIYNRGFNVRNLRNRETRSVTPLV